MTRVTRQRDKEMTMGKKMTFEEKKNLHGSALSNSMQEILEREQKEWIEKILTREEMEQWNTLNETQQKLTHTILERALGLTA